MPGNLFCLICREVACNVPKSGKNSPDEGMIFLLTYQKRLFINVEILFIKNRIQFIYNVLILFKFVEEVNIFCNFFV